MYPQRCGLQRTRQNEFIKLSKQVASAISKQFTERLTRTERRAPGNVHLNQFSHSLDGQAGSVFCLRCPVDSMRDAVLTVSPNKQYLGIFIPTTPAAQGPAHNITLLVIYKAIGQSGKDEWNKVSWNDLVFIRRLLKSKWTKTHSRATLALIY